MTDIQHLVKRAQDFSKESGLSLSTISTKIFNDGKRLDKLKAGKVRAWPDTLTEALTKLIALETAHKQSTETPSPSPQPRAGRPKPTRKASPVRAGGGRA